MAVPQERKGKRPMRVSTLLKKEKEGTLFKASAAGGGQAIAYQSSNEPPGPAAKKPKSESDVPSREDGREMATTVYSPAGFVNNVAATTSTTGGLP